MSHYVSSLSSVSSNPFTTESLSTTNKEDIKNEEEIFTSSFAELQLPLTQKEKHLLEHMLKTWSLDSHICLYELFYYHIYRQVKVLEDTFGKRDIALTQAFHMLRQQIAYHLTFSYVGYCAYQQKPFDLESEESKFMMHPIVIEKMIHTLLKMVEEFEKTANKFFCSVTLAFSSLSLKAKRKIIQNNINNLQTFQHITTEIKDYFHLLLKIFRNEHGAVFLTQNTLCIIFQDDARLSDIKDPKKTLEDVTMIVEIFALALQQSITNKTLIGSCNINDLFQNFLSHTTKINKKNSKEFLYSFFTAQSSLFALSQTMHEDYFAALHGHLTFQEFSQRAQICLGESVTHTQFLCFLRKNSLLSTFFSFIFYDIFRNYENAISQCLYGSGSYFTLDDHFNKLIHFLEGIVYLTDETSLKTTKMQQDTLFYEQAFQKIDQAIENLGERIIPTEILEEMTQIYHLAGEKQDAVYFRLANWHPLFQAMKHSIATMPKMAQLQRFLQDVKSDIEQIACAIFPL